jgi:hypothetical protein
MDHADLLVQSFGLLTAIPADITLIHGVALPVAGARVLADGLQVPGGDVLP